MIAMIETNAHLHVIFLSGLDQQVQLGHIACGGFLDKDMFASLDGSQAGFHQRIVCRGDNYNIDIWMTCRSRPIGGCLTAWKSCCQRAGTFFIHISTYQKPGSCQRFGAFLTDQATA